MECRPEAVEACSCSAVNLSAETRNFLRRTRWGCLCNDCLRHFEHLTQRARQSPRPLSPDQLQEGVHFYIDRGRWVFTELYHYLKGACCGNGCRHCVYGASGK